MIEATVLITAAIRPPDKMPYLKMKDATSRLIATKMALFFWATQGVRNLVIADATDSRVLNEEEMALLRQMRVNVEQIHFAQDEAQVSLLGKGYAEGKLIEFALENSRLLAQEEYFFKCTGKIFCRNFQNIIALIQHHKLHGLFWQLYHLGKLCTFLDTRFYYTSATFFKENLAAGYALSNDMESMENKENKCVEKICGGLLDKRYPQGHATRPLLSGFGGGTGEQIEAGHLGELDQNFPCWFQA
ncbi:hypothetical protein AGMMS50256_15280 [Betaproteobacteria bacterium]|nr:hypothetical protein AGMMS50256_15280 [Betaproteobacteria bacterium]